MPTALMLLGQASDRGSPTLDLNFVVHENRLLVITPESPPLALVGQGPAEEAVVAEAAVEAPRELSAEAPA